MCSIIIERGGLIWLELGWRKVQFGVGVFTIMAKGGLG